MTASPGDGEHAAREGYYPDPSIPGYVRYWNGSAWVPGTSRPAASAPAPVEETGPVFLDETSATEALPEPEPEPEPVAVPAAAAWQADPAHQAGFGGPRDVRVSWGNREEAPERGSGVSLARPATPGPEAEEDTPDDYWPGATRSPADRPGPGGAAEPGEDGYWPGATRAPADLPGRGGADGRGADGWGAERSAAGRQPLDEPGPDGWGADRPAPARRAGEGLPAQASGEGVGILSARSPAAAVPAASAPAPVVPEWPAAPGGGGAGSGVTSSWPEAAPRPAPTASAPKPGSPAWTPEAAPAGWAPEAAPRPAPAVSRTPAPAGWAPEAPAAQAPRASSRASAEWAPEAAPAPAVSSAPDPAGRTPDARAPRTPRSAAPAPAEWTPDAPAGSASAPAARRGPAAAAPGPQRPRAGEATAHAVFERMAERAARPAGLVRRALARLLDSLVLGAVAVAVARPLLPEATAHLQAKVDAARWSGHTTTVWLLDGVITGYLGLVLGAVLLFGILYEALPTARWGRTPGKKLLGIRVLATATLRPPTFGAALRRWLVYAFLGLPGSLWCLVDRPRRQAWHDKAAKTFVTR